MHKEKVITFNTEYAPGNRLSHDEIIRQHKTWAEQKPTFLISNAFPDLMVILNEYRQIVFSNDHFQKLTELNSTDDCLGLRPGELLGCVHSCETDGGCGTTRFCGRCGALKAILRSLEQEVAIEECIIDRGNNFPLLELRVWTTPVELNNEEFVIFTIHDISIEKENTRLLEQVQKLAILDPLTDILNRRAFFDIANREITRSLRYRNPFSIIMIDLDRFKLVNDTYGHPAGDAVLREIVRVIKLNLREIDTLARYGGDEFIILLPETGMAGGCKVADRIMSAGDTSVYLYRDFEIPMSFSAGTAEFLYDSDHDIDDVINRADKELYIMKKKRNQIQID
jgi:diguanylate cyclase (GGDEF)-like protein